MLRDLRLAVGIVEIQHLRLREHVGRAEAGRMMWVPLYLDGPAHLVRNDSADRVTVQHAGASIEVGQRRYDVRGITHGRNKVAGRLARVTACEPAEGEGSRHELEDMAALRRAGQRLGQPRKFLGSARDESGVLSPLPERPPLAGYRWHMEQSVKSLLGTWYCAMRLCGEGVFAVLCHSVL